MVHSPWLAGQSSPLRTCPSSASASRPRGEAGESPLPWGSRPGPVRRGSLLPAATRKALFELWAEFAELEATGAGSPCAQRRGSRGGGGREKRQGKEGGHVGKKGCRWMRGLKRAQLRGSGGWKEEGSPRLSRWTTRGRLWLSEGLARLKSPKGCRPPLSGRGGGRGSLGVLAARGRLWRGCVWPVLPPPRFHRGRGATPSAPPAPAGSHSVGQRLGWGRAGAAGGLSCGGSGGSFAHQASLARKPGAVIGSPLPPSLLQHSDSARGRRSRTLLCRPR